MSLTDFQKEEILMEALAEIDNDSLDSIAQQITAEISSPQPQRIEQPVKSYFENDNIGDNNENSDFGNISTNQSSTAGVDEVRGKNTGGGVWRLPSKRNLEEKRNREQRKLKSENCLQKTTASIAVTSKDMDMTNQSMTSSITNTLSMNVHDHDLTYDQDDISTFSSQEHNVIENFPSGTKINMDAEQTCVSENDGYIGFPQIKTNNNIGLEKNKSTFNTSSSNDLLLKEADNKIKELQTLCQGLRTSLEGSISDKETLSASLEEMQSKNSQLSKSLLQQAETKGKIITMMEDMRERNVLLEKELDNCKNEISHLETKNEKLRDQLAIQVNTRSTPDAFHLFSSIDLNKFCLALYSPSAYIDILALFKKENLIHFCDKFIIQPFVEESLSLVCDGCNVPSSDHRQYYQLVSQRLRKCFGYGYDSENSYTGSERQIYSHFPGILSFFKMPGFPTIYDISHGFVMFYRKQQNA